MVHLVGFTIERTWQSCWRLAQLWESSKQRAFQWDLWLSRLWNWIVTSPSLWGHVICWHVARFGWKLLSLSFGLKYQNAGRRHAQECSFNWRTLWWRWFPFWNPVKPVNQPHAFWQLWCQDNKTSANCKERRNAWQSFGTEPSAFNL